jgi:hypothetical protein
LLVKVFKLAKKCTKMPPEPIDRVLVIIIDGN